MTQREKYLKAKTKQLPSISISLSLSYTLFTLISLWQIFWLHLTTKNKQRMSLTAIFTLTELPICKLQTTMLMIPLIPRHFGQHVGQFNSGLIKLNVGPLLTEFPVDRMAFGQS